MCEFWTAFGAIGTTLGSLITAGAVIVAVRQYKLPMRKELKIVFSRSLIFPPIENIKNDYYCVNISNIGIRNIRIKGIYLNIGNYAIMDKNKDMQLPNNRVNFPIILEPEDDLEFILLGEKIDDAIKDSIENGTLKPFDKVKIHVQDSSGKNYFYKIKQRAKDLFDNFQK